MQNLLNWSQRRSHGQQLQLRLSCPVPGLKETHIVNKFLYTSFPLWIHDLIRHCLNSGVILSLCDNAHSNFVPL